ncbi:ALP1-like protein [Tanacetum coccineum]
MLEVVASHDLWIWHAFFRAAGAYNDIHVLDHSLLFDDLLDDIAHIAPFEILSTRPYALLSLDIRAYDFLHGMDVIACLHDMVYKLAFMAWLLACLHGMYGKMQELEDDDEVGNLAMEPRPWNKAYGLRAWTFDALSNAYEVSVSCRARVKVEPPSA